MSGRGLIARVALALTALAAPALAAPALAAPALATPALAAPALATPARAVPPTGGVQPARVQGRFTMRTVITTAVDVRGEHRGERLARTWRIRPGGCLADLCRVLHLRRTRGLGRSLRLTLYLRRDGSYVGRGTFFAALSCRGRIDRRGELVPYTIRLWVTATRSVGGIRFARRLRATYVNRTRIDRTHCAMGPSYDAARYRGRLRGGLPSPPQPAFTEVVGADGLVSFADASRPGTGPGRRIVAWSWNFGDPASGAANASNLESPTHQFAQPGSYVVSLTATDHAGLSATVTEPVVVPAASPSPAG